MYAIVARYGVRVASRALGRAVARGIARLGAQDAERAAMGGLAAGIRDQQQKSIRDAVGPQFHVDEYGYVRQRYVEIGGQKVLIGNPEPWIGEIVDAKLMPEMLVALLQTAFYLAYAYGYAHRMDNPYDLGWIVWNRPATDIVLPEGCEWVSGPCLNWEKVYDPVKPGIGVGTACQEGIAGGSPPVPATDAEVNAALEGGRTITYAGSVPRPGGASYAYKVYGSFKRAAVGPYEPYEEKKHGATAPGGLSPSWLQDQVRDFWKEIDAPELDLPWDKLAEVLAQPSIADTMDEPWWNERAKNWRIPVFIIPKDGTITVPFPSRGNGKGVDVTIPIIPPFPVTKPDVGNPPITGVRPDVNVDTGVKPGVKDRPGINDVVDPGVDTPTRDVLTRGGANVQVVAGPVTAARTNIREGKPARSNAIYYAMQVRGQISEVEDAVKAFYKALPASLRRRIRAQLGHQPTILEMMREVYKHWKIIDVEEALANVLITQVDDMISAHGESGVDDIIRTMIPDFEARMLLRAIMRAGRHGESMPGPSVAKIDEAIRKDGKVGWTFADLFRGAGAKREY